MTPDERIVPRVVHCKREPYDVLIDRTTKWGNPWRIGSHGTRADVIRKYRAWLMEDRQADLRDEVRRVLRGKTLGCWCAPRPCHGDVLLEIANDK